MLPRSFKIADEPKIMRKYLVFFGVFWDACVVDFFSFGCPKPPFRHPFWLHFDDRSGPFGKQLKVLEELSISG